MLEKLGKELFSFNTQAVKLDQKIKKKMCEDFSTRFCIIGKYPKACIIPDYKLKANCHRKQE